MIDMKGLVHRFGELKFYAIRQEGELICRSQLEKLYCVRVLCSRAAHEGPQSVMEAERSSDNPQEQPLRALLPNCAELRVAAGASVMTAGEPCDTAASQSMLLDKARAV
jgi:hypothetical protein